MADWHVVKLRIVGTSGSGKSALAQRLAAELDLPRLDLDAVFWDAGWTHRDPDEARALVREFLVRHPDRWVADGNWSTRLDGLLDPGTPGGADTFVWLDHSRPLVMSRVIRRTVRRGILREELWHGNRERASSWLRWDPEENIMRWAWVQHPVTRRRMQQRIVAGDPVVRLSGQREVDRWVAHLIDGQPSG
jgi:adenylate kinase family enzyme